MCSKGSHFILGVWGMKVIIRNRSPNWYIAVPMVNSATEIILGNFRYFLGSFRVAGGAFRDIQIYL